MPPEQAVHSDLIVVWGNNVTVCNLHLARIIKAARAKGAKLVVVDPKRTRIAEQADLFLQVKPGSDVVLALALARALEERGAFDRAFIARWVEGLDAYMAEARKHDAHNVERDCTLTRQEFETFVEWYAKAERVAVSIGNGMERGYNGGSGLRAAMAVQALTGNFGRPGAGVIAKSGLAAPGTSDRLQRPDLVPPGTRCFNIVDMAEKILDERLDPPLAALFIYNHNPLATHPDQNRMKQALGREDLFIAGAEIAMTDSMAYCDVVLPAASHFEYPDVYGSYGQNYLQRAEAVIAPVGEALPNTEIFRRLAARFGFDDPLFRESDRELMDAAYDAGDPRLRGLAPSRFPLGRALEMQNPDGEEMVFCKTVLPATGSGKIELFSQDLEERYGYGVPRYEAVPQDAPFVVVSPASSKRTNATFGGCEESQGLEVLDINPKDAEAKGIADGQRVRVWNRRGETCLIARISDSVKPGILYTYKGVWLSGSPNGQTINALIPSGLRTDIEDGACYNETFADIAPWPGGR
jgi:anaerobic selenocysteine-containing dehydrogenase